VDGRPVASVPTPDALHDGHRAPDRHPEKHAGTVVAGVFREPPRFRLGEDSGGLPRALDADLEDGRAEDADVVFGGDGD